MNDFMTIFQVVEYVELKKQQTLEGAKCFGVELQYYCQALGEIADDLRRRAEEGMKLYERTSPDLADFDSLRDAQN